MRVVATMGTTIRSALGGLWWELISGARLGSTSLAALLIEPIGLAVLARWTPPSLVARARVASRPPGDRVIAPDGGRSSAEGRDQAPAGGLDQPYLWLPVLVAIGLLFFLVGPLGREIREPVDSPDRVLTYLGLAAFVLVYLWAIPRDLAGRRGARLGPAVVVLAGLAVAISLLDSRAMWTVLFIATAAGAGRLTPSRTALAAIAAISVLAAVALLAHGVESIRTLESAVEVALVGLVVVGFSQYERASRDLRIAEAHVARVATDVERARIARDLHDLLGHSLSMIALKTELARKLIVRDPERAASELADVEEVVRTSLRDVRQAVAGYRQVDLEAELAGARVALIAAGFEVLIERPEDPLDAPTDSLLGWVVREGVTNVVRHSTGAQCSISIERTPGTVTLEILDDGPSPVPGVVARASVGTGRGLRGIRERVAQAGGTMEAGWQAGGGYRLLVSVPADGPAAGRAGMEART
jgi:two-component system, NarL family, sensor histidine kinase DesK